MNRRTLLVSLCCAGVSGCVSPTGDPPPYPQPSFEYAFVRVDGQPVIEVTVVDEGGLTTEPVRVLVNGRVAYANGSFRQPYNGGSASENEWADGIQTGDSISVSHNSSFDRGVEVEIRLRRSDTGELVTVGVGELRRRSPQNDTDASPR